MGFALSEATIRKWFAKFCMDHMRDDERWFVKFCTDHMRDDQGWMFKTVTGNK